MRVYMKMTTKRDGKYYPDYSELMKQAKSAEELSAIAQEAEKDFTSPSALRGYVFNGIHMVKYACCGKITFFQFPINEFHNLEEDLAMHEQEVATHLCSQCMNRRALSGLR